MTLPTSTFWHLRVRLALVDNKVTYYLHFSLFSSTFFIIDLRKPLKLQCARQLSRMTFEISEICTKLQPVSGTKGKYTRVVTDFFFFEFSSTIAASAKKDRYVPCLESKVDVSKILPCNSRVEIVVILEELQTINLEHILGSFTVEIEKDDAFTSDTLTPAEAATAVLKKTLSRLTPKVGTKAPTPEVSVTTSFADQLNASGQWTDFEVGHHTRHQSSNSTADLEIYHRDKFVSHAVIRGAVCSRQPEAEELEVKEDEMVLKGAVGEMKLHIEEGSDKENGIGQLRCYMLKMAGTLALEAVRTVTESFTKIIIYGLLINRNDTKNTSVGRLTMDFKKQKCHIAWSKDCLELTACLERIHYILSGDDTYAALNP